MWAIILNFIKQPMYLSSKMRVISKVLRKSKIMVITRDNINN